MGRMIITETQLKMLKEYLCNPSHESINEGTWENVKYGLSKLGRYKAGGKIFGKGGVDNEARANMQAIIEKKGNEVIAQLDAKIKSANPEFPNNKEGIDFLKTVMSIAAVYDSIVAATNLHPENEKYLPPDAANGIINDLREYVKKFLDVDLKGVYSVVDENEVINLEEDDSADVRAHLQSKRGDGKDFKSDRMSTLKSNKLPLTLMGVGSSLGAFSWLVNTDWFKHLFETVVTTTDPDTVVNSIETLSVNINDIKPNEGVYKLLGRVTDMHLDGNSSPNELINALKEVGGGDANKGIDMLCQNGGVMMQPDAAAKGLHDLVANPNQYHTLNDMFQGGTEDSGTGKINPVNSTNYGTIAGRSLTSILIKVLPEIIIKGAVKTGIKTGAGYAAAKGFGAILGPIGVTLLATGALVKIMRMKGQKQSRAKTLNDLYQSIRNIEGGVGIIKPTSAVISGKEFEAGVSEPIKEPEVPKQVVARGTVPTTTSVSTDDVYNSLRNLFKFIVSNRNTLGIRSASDVPSKDRGTYFHKMKNGDNVFYNGKPVKILNTDTGTPNRTLVQYSNGTKIAVDSNKLHKLQESIIHEGKFIKNKQVIQAISKGITTDKLNSFEEFMTRLEQVRNKIRNLKPTGDKVLDNWVKKIKSDHLIATDFKRIFTIDPKNQNVVSTLISFINKLFATVYGGKFKNGQLMDKIAASDNLEEGVDSADPTAFARIAQDRGKFNKNVLTFLSDSIGFYQYLAKIKANTKQSSVATN